MKYNNRVPVFYAGLVCQLHTDIAQCYVGAEVIHVERQHITNCMKSIGISYLTKILPGLGKAVDKALATNTRLAKLPGMIYFEKSRIPLFLGYLLDRVFDEEGWELCNSCPVALKHFRQFVYLFYKLEIPYDQETEKSALVAFVETDAAICETEEACDRDCDWIVHAREVVTRVVSGLDPYEIIPRHGPGSVATGEDIFEKTIFTRIYSSLEKVYPFTEWMCWNLNHVAESLPRNVSNTHWLRPGRYPVYFERLEHIEEPTAKLVLVPKDSRGPRLISCEPPEVQWIQQGLKDILQNRIETSLWSRGQVNFTDQTVNRRLALLGSKGHRWVTLDLKDASDRVGTWLVGTLFRDHPALLDALMAARSTGTKLPDGTVVRLKKFAPMGSATCFPVESLVFYALAVSAVHMNRRISWRDARKAVFVYGDDIICMEQDYETILQQFPKAGLKFSDGKCCVGRFFRESCGCDAYKGVDITPVRLKTPWRCQPNAKVLDSYVALHNAMFGLGLEGTANYIAKHLDQVYGLLPRTNNYREADNGSWVAQSGCPALVCWESASTFNRNCFEQRVNRKDYAEPTTETFTWTIVPEKARTPHDGYPEMLRRYSAGSESRAIGSYRWTPYRGMYTLARRSSLKRAWVVV